MKPFFIYILLSAAFLAMAEEPAPKIITAKTEIAEKIDLVGTLKLNASMDSLNGWFFVDFLDAQKQPVTSIRFDPRKLISDGGYRNYERALAPDEKVDFEVKTGRIRSYRINTALRPSGKKEFMRLLLPRQCIMETLMESRSPWKDSRIRPLRICRH